MPVKPIKKANTGEAGLNAEQNRQNQIDLNLQLLRAQYGLGADPNDIQKQIEALHTSGHVDPGATPPPAHATSRAIFGAGGAASLAHTEALTPEQRIAQQNQLEQNAENAASQNMDLKDLFLQHGVAEQGQQNQAKINSWLDSIQQDQEKLDTTQLDRDYGNVQAQARNQLADQGLTGGSVDVANRRRQLTQYVQGRQQAVLAGRQARSDANQNLVQARQRAEAQIGSGTTLNPDFNAEGAQIQSGLSTSRSLIAPTAVGQAFTLGGSMAGNYIGEHPRAPGGGGGSDAGGYDTGEGNIDAQGRIIKG